jgi:hypothetical protein
MVDDTGPPSADHPAMAGTASARSNPMGNQSLAARLDVLGLAVQEIARALTPAQAAQAREALGWRLADIVGTSPTPEIDEAIAVDLGPLLAVLRTTAH